jgi:hypothetical protein
MSHKVDVYQLSCSLYNKITNAREIPNGEKARKKTYGISYSVARGLNFKFRRTYFFWHKLYSFDASKVSFTPLKLPFGLASLGVLSLEGRDVITGHLQY